MKNDPDYIIKLEKAIEEKYGTEAINNPASHWTPDREPEYIKESKELLKKETLSERTKEKVDFDGVLIPKKLINKNNNRHCPYCSTYSFDKKDDVYFAKFGSCIKCFVKYIEGREERWKSGWRPNGV